MSTSTCGKARCYDNSGRTTTDSQFSTSQSSVQNIATCVTCSPNSTVFAVSGRAVASVTYTGVLFYALNSSAADVGIGTLPYVRNVLNTPAAYWIAPFAGTLDGLTACIDALPSVGNTITIQTYLSRINAFDTTQQTPQIAFTSTSTGVLLADTANSFSFLAGDIISVGVEVTGSRSQPAVAWGVRITPTNT